MSCSYAEGLSEYHDKGKLGLPEKFDSSSDIETKVNLLADWMAKAKHIIVHTGAGISTSAGIPDFRGPKGVWTLEKKGEKPEMNVSWDDAQPTKTHMALAKLVEVGKVKFIVTQNIDGLHLRSGVPRTSIAELHGNMFVDQCDKCHKMFVRDSPAPTVGQKYVGGDCPATRHNGRNCRGKLKDFVLDWEAELPDSDLTLSDTHSMMADLSIVMGSTLQIIPAGNLPTYTKKYQEDGKLVICNLQPTKQDKKADLSIHTYVDDVMEMVMKKLGLEIPEYDGSLDPVRLTRMRTFPKGELFIDWTQDEENAKDVKKIGDLIHDEYLKKRREEKKRKNSMDILDRGDIKTSKMQKKVEDLSEGVKEEAFKFENGTEDVQMCESENLPVKSDDQFKIGRSCKKTDAYDYDCEDDDFDLVKNNTKEKDEDSQEKNVNQFEGKTECKESENIVENSENNGDHHANSSRSCKKTDVYEFEEKSDVYEHRKDKDDNNDEDHGARNCKKTDAYQFESDLEFGSKKNRSETIYTSSSRNCKKTDSYEFEDDEFS
eukprot:GFUD01022834.1.p1 GENE.GFUD01022834.1~~GFUD01022834.1.p1  ORF type:complete len:544 (+),score=184.86 GFUD01022834.1:45-1676(+)